MQQQLGADLFGDHLKGCFTLISGAGLGRLRLGEWGWGSWGSLASRCSLCRLSSTVSSGVLVFLSQLGAPKVCVLSWAEASHIVPSAPFYWGAVTKIGQVPGKGSWTPPPRGEKSVSACGRAGWMENTVAPGGFWVTSISREGSVATRAYPAVGVSPSPPVIVFSAMS